MGKGTLIIWRLHLTLRALIQRFLTLLSHDNRIHKARFARTYELTRLLSPMPSPGTLLVGTNKQGDFVSVAPTKTRRELGNMLVVAPTRGGKGLLAVSQLLSWKHSVVVNDIKGDLFTQTAGYRRTLGPVFVIDPTASATALILSTTPQPKTSFSPPPPIFSSSLTKERGGSSPTGPYSCSPKCSLRQDWKTSILFRMCVTLSVWA